MRWLWQGTALFTTLVAHAYAYELATHANVTTEAYNRSTLTTAPRLLADLGLHDGNDPFGNVYYDMSGNGIEPRYIYEFERSKMPEPENKRLSVRTWIMAGAVREDDSYGESNPQDDPFNPALRRPLHHFFDPVFNRPLDRFGLSSLDSDVHKAPDWGIGTRDAFSQVNTPEASRRNHFTVFDAQEAMYRAVTGKKKDGMDAGRNNTKATESDRKAYWATTFRALGDVVHLVQDMAQPQHTRNDAHAGKFPEYLTGHTSVFEKYMDARAAGALSYRIDGTAVPLNPLSFGTYPSPVFPGYSAFFSTREGLNGKGLADYSNRGFFSAGSNLGGNTYSSPPNDPNAYSRESTAIAGLVPGNPFVKMDFLLGGVADTLNPSANANIRLTTESIFDYFLGQKRTYSLNRFNYDDKANLLIPRAVAYSAGFLDYFFRGRMEISLPDEGVYGIVDHAVAKQPDQGFTKIKLKLKNTTPAITEPGGSPVPQHMTGGTLVAVAKYYRNPCYQPDLSGELVQTGFPSGCSQEFFFSTTEEIAVSARMDNVALSSTTTLPQTFTFDFSQSPIPINARDLYLQVVFRGGLGSESDAVVVTTKDISEPTYISYLNSTDYFWVLDNFYTPGEISNSALLYGWLKRICDSNSPIYPPNINPEPLQFQYRFGGPVLATVTLPAKRYARIAVLVDYDVPILSPDALLPLSGVCFYEPWATEFKGFFGARNQLDKDTNLYHHTWVEKFRGLNRVNIGAGFKTDPSVLSILPAEVTNELANKPSLPDDGPYPVTIMFE